MSEFNKIAVVGGGLIGMSWASLFLARGCEVVVIDQREVAGAELREFTEAAWPMLRSLELTVADDPRYARFTTDWGSLGNVHFVQECGPDRLDVKHDLVRHLEDRIRPETVISSSSSSFTASEIQLMAKRPDRILVGHPMNPPHLIPMVELVQGRETSELSMSAAENFYQQMKRVTVRVKKEVIGHLANRLTSALYREAVYIVAEGIASVADVDKAITYGPGMRWSLTGPHLTYHLGGGAGGYRHYLDHLGPTQEARWKAHGVSKLTDNVKAALIAGMNSELLEQDTNTLIERRDSALVELFKLKKKYGF